MQEVNLKVEGMHCAACAMNISKALQKQQGVGYADVNYATEKANIKFDEKKIQLSELKKEIQELGYRLVDGDDLAAAEQVEVEYEKSQRLKVIISILLSIPLVVRMFWMWQINYSLFGIYLHDWLQLAISLLVVLYIGKQFHSSAWQQLKRLKFNMDSLISLGTLTALFYSIYALFFGGHVYFESAVAIISLILLGKYFELKTKGRASRAMRKLMELGVKKARVIDKGGKEIEKDINDIVLGDIILVKASEKIPLDGEVIEGESLLDESMLTGESMPVLKNIGSKVFGATINKDGVLKIRVTQIGQDTVLAKIIKTVEEAQNFKAPIQKLADKISGIFVPTVIVIAILSFIGWWVITGDLSISIINAVAVLIIACPCALGIATPVAVMVGTSVGARNGILIKNGDSFEKANDIDIIVFDKTGTLTRGEPAIKKIIRNEKLKINEEEFFSTAFTLADNSEHPLSKVISKYFKDQGVKKIELADTKEIPGMGLSARDIKSGKKILLGNKKLLTDNNINIDWAENIIEQQVGQTVIFISSDTFVLGAIAIADELRDDSVSAIKAIKQAGIKAMMITGDNHSTAQVIATELGIDDFLAEVLPHEKQAKIKELQVNNKVVFVGDGINDAPSLVQADLGIAMGSGTDIAKESGNIILMQNNPLKVMESVRLARQTFKIIKQNLFWAFFYNVLAIPLAIIGLINPMVAALAMSFSSISVIGNSLRIYKK